MVKLTEVEDETFLTPQAGEKDFHAPSDDEYVDTDSSVSSDDDSDDESELGDDETFYDRLVALKDIIPLKHRNRVSNFVGGVYGAVSGTLRFGGNAVWVLSTSAIMLGVPYALAVGEEQQMVEMEKEMKAQQLASVSVPTPGCQGRARVELEADHAETELVERAFHRLFFGPACQVPCCLNKLLGWCGEEGRQKSQGEDCLIGCMILVGVVVCVLSLLFPLSYVFKFGWFWVALDLVVCTYFVGFWVLSGIFTGHRKVPGLQNCGFLWGIVTSHF